MPARLVPSWSERLGSQLAFSRLSRLSRLYRHTPWFSWFPMSVGRIALLGQMEMAKRCFRPLELPQLRVPWRIMAHRDPRWLEHRDSIQFEILPLKVAQNKLHRLHPKIQVEQGMIQKNQSHSRLILEKLAVPCCDVKVLEEQCPILFYSRGVTLTASLEFSQTFHGAFSFRMQAHASALRFLNWYSSTSYQFLGWPLLENCLTQPLFLTSYKHTVVSWTGRPPVRVISKPETIMVTEPPIVESRPSSFRSMLWWLASALSLSCRSTGSHRDIDLGVDWTFS